MTVSLDAHATKRTNQNIFFGKHENKSEWTAEKGQSRRIAMTVNELEATMAQWAMKASSLVFRPLGHMYDVTTCELGELSAAAGK